jgi:hypothetical protein
VVASQVATTLTPADSHSSSTARELRRTRLVL